MKEENGCMGWVIIALIVLLGAGAWSVVKGVL